MPKKRPKTKPNQIKTIWLELNPKIGCSLLSLASINHISLVSTPISKLFKELDYWLSKLHNHMWLDPRKSLKINFMSLCYYSLCIALIQSTIYLLFQFWIGNHFKCWILDFLRFKTICDFTKENHGK